MEKINLYLVATPIGNKQDMTFRAVEVLHSVDKILAEDTRTSKKLLEHYNIKTPITSYHSHNEHIKTDDIIKELQSGKIMAQISDAGTPGISDPGYWLVNKVLEANMQVTCIPGACALIPALIKSGFPSDRFIFEGFLPKKKGRIKRLVQIAASNTTTIIYESPHRLLKLLDELYLHLGNNWKLSVSRELTKMYEETHTGNFEEVIKKIKEKEKIKGEYVIIVTPCK